jgi:hypothetical protein
VQVGHMSAGDCGNAPIGTLATSASYLTWTEVTGYKPQAQFYAPSYASNGPTAAYVVDSSSAAASWDLSTFTADENSVADASGSLQYDLGASDDSTPVYSLSSLSKAQVLASSAPTGRYLFVRARFVGDGFQNASLGGMTVSYTP